MFVNLRRFSDVNDAASLYAFCRSVGLKVLVVPYAWGLDGNDFDGEESQLSGKGEVRIDLGMMPGYEEAFIEGSFISMDTVNAIVMDCAPFVGFDVTSPGVCRLINWKAVVGDGASLGGEFKPTVGDVFRLAKALGVREVSLSNGSRTVIHVRFSRFFSRLDRWSIGGERFPAAWGRSIVGLIFEQSRGISVRKGGNELLYVTANCDWDVSVHNG